MQFVTDWLFMALLLSISDKGAIILSWRYIGVFVTFFFNAREWSVFTRLQNIKMIVTNENWIGEIDYSSS